MNDQFTIVVSSCDAYEDCWVPFFSLFKRHWPDCENRIVLNTETKIFEFPGLSITCPTVARNSRKEYGWGERFLKCLDTIETEFILLFLDDYFIRAPVRTHAICEFVSLMQRAGLSHIALVSLPGPNRPSSYPGLLERGEKAPYRFSLQVGLWRKNRLKLYLRGHENPWQSEIWGTKRAWRIKDSFYCFDGFDKGSYRKIVDYDDTGGIARGKWIKDKVVEMFREDKIEMDFSRRGFYDPEQRVALSVRLRRKILNIPSQLRSLAGLYLMRPLGY
jgi:hypothetical protein